MADTIAHRNNEKFIEQFCIGRKKFSTCIRVLPTFGLCSSMPKANIMGGNLSFPLKRGWDLTSLSLVVEQDAVVDDSTRFHHG